MGSSQVYTGRKNTAVYVCTAVFSPRLLKYCYCVLKINPKNFLTTFFTFYSDTKRYSFHTHTVSQAGVSLDWQHVFFRKGYLKLVLCCFLRYSIQWQSREPDQFLVCPKPYRKSQGQLCSFGNILIVNIWAPGWLSRKSVRPLISGSWI